jgi:geranylgeranyl diphosphate synthase type II
VRAGIADRARASWLARASPIGYIRIVSDRGRAFAAYLQRRRDVVEKALDGVLPPAREEPRVLHRAMRYSMFAGGKRLRPILCLLAGEACGARTSAILPVACAIECVHTYSLIHDDLPCMDDDDLRRGRPSCHKVFGEAIALLAGDGLLTLAFETLARGIRDARRAAAVATELARAAGTRGMVGGQTRDLLAERTRPTRRDLERIHRGKTAALVAASLRMGALAAGARARTVDRLGRFGLLAGHAFQITDDVIDVRSPKARLGKTPGKDARQGKATYPALFGIAGARGEARRYAERAKVEVEGVRFDSILQGFAELAVERSA